MRKWNNPNKKAQVILLDKVVVYKIKGYAQETGQSFDDVTKDEQEAFNQAILKKAREIDEIRFRAFEVERKRKEEQDIADQIPMKVVGREVDTISVAITEPEQKPEIVDVVHVEAEQRAF